MPAPRWRPWIVLTLVWAAYFHPLLLQPSGTLYTDYSDLASEHLPGRIFLVSEWRSTGELPLWNPYHFCGSPFIHDIQAGTFYPPYAVTFLFLESQAGSVMSWVIALHVLAASMFAFVYARRHGLNEAGSLVCGIGFAYSAKWLTHLILAGHTITIGLAWLPLVLLGLESRRLAGMLGGAVAFALLILGTHPQWTFYSGLFIAAWTLPAERTRPNLLRWLGCGTGVVLIAGLLAAVQLLPTAEASRYSTRTAGLQSTQSLAAGMFSLLAMIGPTAEYNPPLSWELRSLLSLFGLAAALLAPRLVPECRWKRTVLLAMLAFSFGGAVLIEWLPGFNLFRSASRMLVIAAFPVAYLAGVATDACLRSEWAQRRTLGIATLIAGAIAGVPSMAVALLIRSRDLPMWPEFGVYWVATLLGLAAVGAVAFAPSLSFRTRSALWFGALLLELFAATLRFPAVKPQSEMYPDSPLAAFLTENTDPASARVIDIELGSQPTDRVAPLGIGSPVALTHRLAMPRGYNPIDVRHYREYLNFTMGSDEPLLSLAAVSHPIVPNFPRRVPSLWEQLNVRYIVCFDDYLVNPAYAQDAGHALKKTDWRIVRVFKPTEPVPALPPTRPAPLPRSLVAENLQYASHPRAFIVPHSEPMPAGRELAALTSTDLRTTVLLANTEPPSRGAGTFRAVPIREYGANRVALDLGGSSGGWLVLNDVWYSGWTCQVDGIDVPLERANHAFRAVRIPDGAKQAVFRFEPASYRLGWWISAITACVVALGGCAAIYGLGRNRK